MPTKCASRPGELRGGNTAWRLYEAVLAHFMASLLPDALYSELTLTAGLGGQMFEFSWHRVTERGWLHAMPWRSNDLGLFETVPASLDSLAVGDTLDRSQVELRDGWTEPPLPLKVRAQRWSSRWTNRVFRRFYPLRLLPAVTCATGE